MISSDLIHLTLQDFPLKTYDKIRYQDTDRQGHINNASFSEFLETGRVELLYHPNRPLATEGASFVIASLDLNLVNELFWPGTVDIGTAIVKIGNSSLHFAQALYQHHKMAATAISVIVQVDNLSRKAKPLTDETKEMLSQYMINFESLKK